MSTTNGFKVVKGTGPKAGPKNGDTDKCADKDCAIIVRFKNGNWVHAIRNNPYNHKPAPRSAA